MRIALEVVAQIFSTLWAHKLRSFLTMFGIAWGVGSLLLLVGLGEGFRSGQHRNLSTFGNDVVMMFNGTIPAVANQHTGMRPYQLTLRDEADLRSLPQFRAVTAMLNRGDLRLVLSVPGAPAGGGQAMPDGTLPQPGGWNRFAVEVPDLDATVAELRRDGVRFRNDVVTGVGGKQIIAEDPSGNPVELFEPTREEARLSPA